MSFLISQITSYTRVEFYSLLLGASARLLICTACSKIVNVSNFGQQSKIELSIFRFRETLNL